MRSLFESITEVTGVIMLGGLLLNLGGQNARSQSVLPDNQHATPTNFWAFQPLRLSSPPAPKSRPAAGSPRNPIDAFVLAKLEENHLAPAPPASRLALVRRVYFDLLGLPPKPEEIQAFINDRRPNAYADLIERLLSSPQYGERWGRHWLDVVRYADTGGSETDMLYDNAWKYRDYVIGSFNADKPFDRFVQEQVAGDELWPEKDEAVTATALYCVGPVLEESAMVPNQLEYEWLTDAVDTTGAAFLGLTVGCARCHNHKYDPIPQKEYFELQAVFAGSDRVYPQAVRDKRIKAIHGLLAEKPLPEELKDDPQCAIQTEKQNGFRLVHPAKPMEVRLLRRGELTRPGEVVEPGFLTTVTESVERRSLGASSVTTASTLLRSTLSRSPVPATQRRAALAKWLTDPTQTPLTARVIVNRVWAWHFGQGLVRTPNDFGSQGDPPTHPELLDWLARDFIDHNWSLKHLHRLIMSSATYQQSSIAADASRLASKSKIKRQKAKVDSAQVDPENRLLWHFPRRRLEAEAIWDSLHASAGTLNLQAFGPPVVPPLSDEELAGLFNASGKWKVTADPSQHTRRAVYLFVRRTFLLPLVDAFDPPEVMTSCPGRRETTVPAQALTLLNSKVAVEQSKAFAARLLEECGPNLDKLVSRAWWLTFSRPITRTEAAKAIKFLSERQAVLDGEKSEGRGPKADPSSVAAGKSTNPSSVGTAAMTNVITTTTLRRVEGNPKAEIRKQTDPAVALEEAVTELCLALFNANEFTYID